MGATIHIRTKHPSTDQIIITSHCYGHDKIPDKHYLRKVERGRSDQGDPWGWWQSSRLKLGASNLDVAPTIGTASIPQCKGPRLAYPRDRWRTKQVLQPWRPHALQFRSEIRRAKRTPLWVLFRRLPVSLVGAV
jgi:hypothetical protein